MIIQKVAEKMCTYHADVVVLVDEVCDLLHVLEEVVQPDILDAVSPGRRLPLACRRRRAGFAYLLVELHNH